MTKMYLGSLLTEIFPAVASWRSIFMNIDLNVFFLASKIVRFE